MRCEKCQAQLVRDRDGTTMPCDVCAYRDLPDWQAGIAKARLALTR